MFLGSSEKVLALIKERAAKDYPHLEVVTYSPPYKETFSKEDDERMIKAINDVKPDLLWIGMTAPKQEKWTYDRCRIRFLCRHCQKSPKMVAGSFIRVVIPTGERAAKDVEAIFGGKCFVCMEHSFP